MPPLPPILVPGLGLMPFPKALDLLAPPLTPEEGIYLNSLTELTAALTGLDQSDLDNPPPSRVVQLLSSPTDQLRELSGALAAVASGGGSTSSGTSGTPDEGNTIRVANREVSLTSMDPIMAYDPYITLTNKSLVVSCCLGGTVHTVHQHCFYHIPVSILIQHGANLNLI